MLLSEPWLHLKAPMVRCLYPMVPVEPLSANVGMSRGSAKLRLLPMVLAMPPRQLTLMTLMELSQPCPVPMVPAQPPMHILKSRMQMLMVPAMLQQLPMVPATPPWQPSDVLGRISSPMPHLVLTQIQALRLVCSWRPSRHWRLALPELP